MVRLILGIVACVVVAFATVFAIDRAGPHPLVLQIGTVAAPLLGGLAATLAAHRIVSDGR